MASHQSANKKMNLAIQILALLGVLLTIFYLVKNASYLYLEIFRDSVSLDYRLVYIVGLVTYLICLAAYLFFALKLHLPALILAFLGVFQIVRRIFSIIQTNNPQLLSAVDLVFCIVAVILLILLLVSGKSSRLLGWLLAIFTLVNATYNIVSNWAALLGMIQSLSVPGENLWNGLINVLNFFNLYLLLAVCFVLAVLAEGMDRTRVAAGQ